MIESNPSKQTPTRAAIIGSGPAGLYTATELLKAYPDLLLDIFEQNWAPFGLIRYGVAPDHQKTKKVTRLLSQVLENSSVRFFGGVTIGQDLSLEELDQFYDLIVVATGAEKARRLDLPGAEDYPTGLDIVTWYNGHPANTQNFNFDFAALAIVGNGNVALDIARLLCQPPEVLKATDLPEPVLQTLLASKVRDIHIIGRRGPAQLAFRPPELKEITHLPHVEIIAPDLEIDAMDTEALNTHEQVLQKKGLSLLREAAGQPKPNASHRIHFHFKRQPISFHPQSLEVGLTRIEGDLKHRHPVLEKEREIIPCAQVIQSIGYWGTAPAGLPREPATGNLQTRNHRIPLPANFKATWVASGWIKKGPQGLIGHNHMDAVEVIRSLEPEPWPSRPHRIDPATLLRERGVHWIDSERWAKLDAQEITKGQTLGKVREKFIQPPKI